MYIPSHFREDRIEVLHRIIEDHSFATVVSTSDEGIFATHVPILLDRARGPLGTLVGHVARANPHWRYLAESVDDALVIFQGPHAYISPSWYASRGRVPTWNYIAVHAYGRPRLIQGVDGLRGIVTETVQLYERDLDPPWEIASLDAAAVDGLLTGIVGFEIPIARLEGKRKLGQNRAPADRTAMVAGLRAHGRDDAQEIATLVEAITGPDQ